jgi:hypothetical protein
VWLATTHRRGRSKTPDPIRTNLRKAVLGEKARSS